MDQERVPAKPADEQAAVIPAIVYQTDNGDDATHLIDWLYLNPDRIEQLANELAALAVQKSYDGLDVDLESFGYRYPMRWLTYLYLLTCLSERLHKSDKSLTVVVSLWDSEDFVDRISTGANSPLTRRVFNYLVDETRLMLYARTEGEMENPPTSHAPWPWVAGKLSELFNANAIENAHRLSLGIPFYGTEWGPWDSEKHVDEDEHGRERPGVDRVFDFLGHRNALLYHCQNPITDLPQNDSLILSSRIAGIWFNPETYETTYYYRDTVLAPTGEYKIIVDGRLALGEKLDLADLFGLGGVFFWNWEHNDFVPDATNEYAPNEPPDSTLNDLLWGEVATFPGGPYTTEQSSIFTTIHAELPDGAPCTDCGQPEQLGDPGSFRWLLRDCQRERFDVVVTWFDAGRLPFQERIGLEVEIPTCGWTEIAPMNQPRAMFTEQVFGGKIYVIGGFDSSFTSVGTVECYDPATGEWEFRSSMPTARHACSSALVDGLIYVFGGSFDWYHDLPITDIIEVYNPATDTWAPGGYLPAPRTWPVAEAIGDDVFITGGYNGYLMLKSGWKFDPDNPGDKWSDIASMPIIRSGHDVVSHGGYLYSLGGYDGSPLLRYDPVADSWTGVDDLERMPTDRLHLRLALEGDTIYATGGSTVTDICFKTVEAYSIPNDTWTRDPDLDLPIELRQHGAVAIGDTIHVFGGRNAAGEVVGSAFELEP